MEATKYIFYNWAMREMEYPELFSAAYYFRIEAAWALNDYNWFFSSG